MKKPFHYRLDSKIRRLLMWIMDSLTTESKEERVDLKAEKIKKILLVRANFRVGESILATPYIFLFRRNFPRATIDFVGPPASAALLQNLPIDRHFSITGRFPQASWAYPALLSQIRSAGYDLAVEVSFSRSALGSFIVGFSGARFRVGVQGRWDRWFNVRIPRAPKNNKYRANPALAAALGLEAQEIFPSLVLSPVEKEEGRKRLETLVGPVRRPIVGVFVGARKSGGKRWPRKRFLQMVSALRAQGISPVVFFGPEEKHLVGFFRKSLERDVPLVYEPSLRIFAAMVSNCHLFVTCDTGPLHLACAVGTRTVAIFQIPKFHRWAPPPSLARVVYEPGGCSVQEVLRVCLLELSHIRAPVSDVCGDGRLDPSPLVSTSVHSEDST